MAMSGLFSRNDLVGIGRAFWCKWTELETSDLTL